MQFPMSAAIAVGMALAASATAQSVSATPQDAGISLTVTAFMDPWRAGGYDDGSDGAAPASFAFRPKQHQYIVFPSVTGSWTCDRVLAEYGPDGVVGMINGVCDNPRTIIGPIGTLSGRCVSGRYPTNLRSSSSDLYVSHNSEGGIRSDFRLINPEIGQVFFIGDGLTGTATGNVQIFLVPPTATHLYMG